VPSKDPVRSQDEADLATYTDMLPGGADLIVLPRADGVQTFIVLKERPDTDRFTFLLDSPDLDFDRREDGSIALRDAEGRMKGLIPAPYAVDSTPVPELGSGRSTSDVTIELGRREGRTALTFVVDQGFLDTAVYPVYVDPLVIIPFEQGTMNDAFVYEGSPTTNYGTYVRPDPPGYGELWLGEKPGSGGKVARALLRFNGLDGLIGGTHITSAVLRVYPYHQGSSPTDTWIKRLTQDWAAMDVNWNNQPATASVVSPDPVSVSTSQGTTAEFELTATVQAWASGTLPNHGLQLHENGNGTSHWKRLISKEQDSARLAAPAGLVDEACGNHRVAWRSDLDRQPGPGLELRRRSGEPCVRAKPLSGPGGWRPRLR